MKLNKDFWKTVLFHIQDKKGEREFNKEWNTILLASQLTELIDNYSNENPYSDTVWEVAELFADIDLLQNPQIEQLFFEHWHKIDYDTKARTYKNIDASDPKDAGVNFFTGEVKQYFIKKVIEYPTLEEIYKFKNKLSQKDLQNSLIKIFNSTKFYKMLNHRKEDFWENHLKGTSPKKLIDLLEIAEIPSEQLIKWNHIGFLNDIRQAKFDQLISPSIIDLLTSENEEVFLITININATAFLELDKKLGLNKINLASNYIATLLEEGIHGEKLHDNASLKELRFLIKNKEDYLNNIKVKDILIDWIKNNPSSIIQSISDITKSSHEIKKEVQQLLPKILLKNSLEHNLTISTNSTRKIKI